MDTKTRHLRIVWDTSEDISEDQDLSYSVREALEAEGWRSAGGFYTEELREMAFKRGEEEPSE